ncbi:MAG: tRNA-dihydrouridine synthase family protein [Desulforhopalus sp.]|nr:tRNA-dihydrouridine synthase family protein [Desulforhopalus sp.]
MSLPPTLFLAPLRGATDYIFRDTLQHHFQGWDCAISPFITPQNNSDFPDKTLKDVLPVNNPGLPLIPQLLTNTPEQFLILSRRLIELGYHHLNWNLGCPAPQVAKKGKGSGMLPCPDKIVALLDTVLPELEQLDCQLSIKMRLGYHAQEESFALLPQLNAFPLREITIHTRLGSQIYRGATDVESFTRCLELSSHRLIYNGDIISCADWHTLQKRFPQISCWMIGRGAIARPFLAEEIKGGECRDLSGRLCRFHAELLTRYSSAFSGDTHIIGRMKLIWNFLINSFPFAEKKLLKKVQKSRTLSQYQDAAESILQTSIPHSFSNIHEEQKKHLKTES